MAGGFRSVRFAVVAVLVVYVLLISGAEAGRPLNILNPMERFFDGLALGAIKDVNSLGGRKNSGPSPGVGHRVVTGSGQ
ncbi:hypothetical protein LINGRAHAP2_LOCUS8803 [Linum grandiflorum]